MSKNNRQTNQRTNELTKNQHPTPNTQNPTQPHLIKNHYLPKD